MHENITPPLRTDTVHCVNDSLTPETGRLTGRDALRIHLGLALCLLICIPAFLFEISRAIGGNALSWAYVIEWPLFVIFGVYMWHRLLQGDSGNRSSAPTDVEATAAGRRPERARKEAVQLDAWNEYLAELHKDETDYDGPGPAS